MTTIHGFSSPQILPVYRQYNKHCHYVSISNADRHPDLDYDATVYHGIDMESFTFRQQLGDYLLFFGRIHPDKGAAEAIQIAHRFGMNLLIAGIIQDRNYFEERVVPHLDDHHVRYLGSADPQARDNLLGRAYALLHPINFDEPFGLSVIEAMACGTPVIAFDRGAMPEVIQEGKTDFLVNDVEAALQQLKDIPRIDRTQCRRWVEEHFTQDRMVEEYINVYQKLLRN